MTTSCRSAVITALAFIFCAHSAQAAKPPASSEPWAMCIPDPLAKEVVPATPHSAPPETLPIDAEAARLDSAPEAAHLEGDAHVSRGDQHLRADRITLERSTQHVRTENGFTYSDPRQVLRGQQADVDLQNKTGAFASVEYFLSEGNAQGSAEKVHVDQTRKQTQLHTATYSTCQRGQEAWQLRAEDMTLDGITERGMASDVVLAFKDTPVLYLPYLSFPITDKRQSGFLASRQGYSTKTGFDVQVPYYWNIAPDQDMTFTPRLMTARGMLLGTEYRYLAPWHHGTLGLEILPDDSRYGGARESFNFTDQATPWLNFSTDIRYEYVSDNDYLRDLSSHLAFLTPNYLERHMEARYDGGNWQTMARLQGYQVLTPSLFARTGRPYERLPQILFNADWPNDSRGNGSLRYQLYSELVHFDQRATDVVTGTRLDLWPTVSTSFDAPWGYLRPQAGLRHTSYQLDHPAPGNADAPTRTAPTFNLDTGLIFERPLATDTQTIEPRLFYLYVPYRNQDDLPIFDSSLMDRDIDWLFRKNRFTGADRLGDAHQITAAVTTRLVDGASGRERMRASVGEIQYFADRRVNLLPNTRETAANSGVIAQGLANLSSDWSVQGGAQLEPNNTDLLRTAVDLRYHNAPHQAVNISYLRDRNRTGFGLDDDMNTVDVSLFWPLTHQWRTLARWNRALNTDRNLEVLAGLEYEDCCWALRMAAREHRDSPINVDTETAFYVEVELKGLSRLGTGFSSQLFNLP